MNNAHPIGFISLLLLILLITVAVSGWLKRRWQLSLNAGFVLVGFIVINILGLIKPVPDLQSGDLQLIVTYILLPILLADGIYRFRIHDLRYQRLKPMLLLPALFFIAWLLTWLFFLWVLKDRTEATLLTALSASFLIYIVDILPPDKILTLLNTLDKSNTDKTRHTSMIQVNALISGVPALVIFLGMAQLLELSTQPNFPFPSLTWYWLFWIWSVLGGVLFGFIWGVIGGLIAANINNYRLNLTLLSVIIWLSYLSSLYYFGVSGIMALLTTTLIMSKAHAQFLTPREIKYIRALFRNMRFIAGVIILGLLINKLHFNLFLNHGFIMLMAVLIFLLSRIISLYGFMPLLWQFFHLPAHIIRQHTLFISTSHSGLIVLAVWLLPETTPYKDSFEAMAIALILVSLFIQRPHLDWLFQQFVPKKPIRGINLIKNRFNQ